MGCPLSTLFTDPCPSRKTERRILMLEWATRSVRESSWDQTGGTYRYHVVDRLGYALVFDLNYPGIVPSLEQFERYQPWEASVELLAKVDENVRLKGEGWRFVCHIKDSEGRFMPSREGRKLDVVLIQKEVACDCGGDGYHIEASGREASRGKVVVSQPTQTEMGFDVERERKNETETGTEAQEEKYPVLFDMPAPSREDAEDERRIEDDDEETSFILRSEGDEAMVQELRGKATAAQEMPDIEAERLEMASAAVERSGTGDYAVVSDGKEIHAWSMVQTEW